MSQNTLIPVDFPSPMTGRWAMAGLLLHEKEGLVRKMESRIALHSIAPRAMGTCTARVPRLSRNTSTCDCAREKLQVLPIALGRDLVGRRREYKH